jgi:ribose/xylose/arabinose/galactoside ABC-type transport system permease subunit
MIRGSERQGETTRAPLAADEENGRPDELLKATADQAASRRGTLARLGLHNRDQQRIAINIGVMLAVGVFVQIHTGYFFLHRNLTGLIVNIAVVAMIACAETLVMVSGMIDVSVAGTVVLSGVVVGLLTVHGMALWLAVIVAILVGGCVGLVNTILIVGLGLPSMIATIATLYVTQGIANILTNGLPIAGTPASFPKLGNTQVFGGQIPIQVFYVLVVLVAFMAIQRYTNLGRYSVATGSNRRAAFLTGVPVRRTILLCFVLTGATAGWSGVVYAARIGNPVPVVDQDVLFQVIVACVVGGTALTGGRGLVLGTFTGALLIAVVNDALDLLGIQIFWQYIALGVLLVLAVGADTAVRGFRRTGQGRRRFVLPDVGQTG